MMRDVRLNVMGCYGCSIHVLRLNVMGGYRSGVVDGTVRAVLTMGAIRSVGSVGSMTTIMSVKRVMILREMEIGSWGYIAAIMWRITTSKSRMIAILMVYSQD